MLDIESPGMRRDHMMMKTLNLDELRQLDTYNGRNQINGRMGSGCFLDPPGFPTYFLRQIYTEKGDEPRSGATEVISFGPMHYITRRAEEWGDTRVSQHAGLMRRLWRRPHFDTIRVQAWVQHLFAYFRNMYAHPTELEYGMAKSVSFPPAAHELRTFRDDPRFNDEWRETERRAVELRNQNVIDERQLIAIPENHLAVRKVLKFYPEQPAESLLPLIENPPTWGKGGVGNWYKYFEVRPPPAICPGDSGNQHPVNGTWCQFCGWVKPEEEK